MEELNTKKLETELKQSKSLEDFLNSNGSMLHTKTVPDTLYILQ